jgi:hypothetical protein
LKGLVGAAIITERAFIYKLNLESPRSKGRKVEELKGEAGGWRQSARKNERLIAAQQSKGLWEALL